MELQRSLVITGDDREPGQGSRDDQEFPHWGRVSHQIDSIFACKRTLGTAADDAVVLRLPQGEAARQLGRTVRSVHMRRWRLGQIASMTGD